MQTPGSPCLPPLFALACVVALAVPLRGQELERAVPPGREVRDSKLLSFGTTDRWKLDVEQDEMLWCTVDSGEFDPVLLFFDAPQHESARADGAGTHSELWLRAPAKGAVEFRVRSAGGAGGGHYTFWLQRYRTEALASNGEATHTFGAEQWWHYRVPLQKGDLLVPSVQGGNLTAVFDAERNGVDQVVFADNRAAGGYRADHDGDHLLRLEGQQGTSCSVTLQLARQRDLPQGGAEDTLPVAGLDLWRLHLAAGAACLVEVAMRDAWPWWDLREAPPLPPPDRGPAFVVTGGIDKGGRSLRWLQARRDCDLEMRLRTNDGAATRYRAVLTMATAELRPGQPIAGELALGGGDLYRLQARSGDQLRIALASQAFDARFDLHDPDGNVIAQGVDDKGPLDRDAEHVFLPARPGCYHVLVYTTAGAGSGAYQLRAELVPVPVVAVGGRLAVSLQPAATTYAQVQLQAGQEVWLAMHSDTCDTWLTVIDPTGDAGCHSEGGGCGDDVLVGYRAAHAGVHTLALGSRRGSGPADVRVVLP